MKTHIARLLIIPALCIAGLLPPKASAAVVVVSGGGPYRYHGRGYRYHRHHHYYNHRAWVVRGRGGYYRYW
ncbi:MAG: hypothetical protein WCD79_00950 [Chthoniobacteraceae bacterium]